ncbi:hypothetical protein GCM10022244_04780 [Streptomyces gulbargensis]|uniref:Uncharacterized protein n=1 Tax=Streptomyces gulbargensis TaxID=364901 RepID=A0ABP7L9K3_9ACTN
MGDAIDDGGEVGLAGDAVVRGRSDGVTAFDVRPGKKRWEYACPTGRDVRDESSPGCRGRPHGREERGVDVAVIVSG